MTQSKLYQKIAYLSSKQDVGSLPPPAQKSYLLGRTADSDRVDARADANTSNLNCYLCQWMSSELSITPLAQGALQIYKHLAEQRQCAHTNIC